MTTKIGHTNSISLLDQIKSPGKKLQEYLYHLSLSSEKETAETILNCLKFCDTHELYATADDFFLALLNQQSSQLSQNLNKVLTICQKGLASPFYKCVSTRKMNYYSPEKLITIIEVFCKILGQIDAPLIALQNCPYFDEGGEEFLEQLARGSIYHTLQEQQLSVLPVPLRSELLRSKFSLIEFKSKIICYLTSLPEKNRLKLNLYIKLFHYLDSDPSLYKFNAQEKIELVKLLIVASTRESEPISQHYALEHFQGILKEALLFYEEWGEDLLLSFCSAIYKNEQPSLENLQRTLWLINRNSHENDNEGLHNLIKGFIAREFSFSQLLTQLAAIPSSAHLEQKVAQDEVCNIISRFKQDPSVSVPLPEHSLNQIEKQYRTIQEYCKKWQAFSSGELISLINTITEDNILQLISIGVLAIRLHFQINLHNTQILTILGLLTYEKGCIAQVKTGEGKSMIIALMAFIMAKQGKTIHIISSARSLAIRDHEKYEKFFSIFGIRTSHICLDNQQPCHFLGQILYGTATDFEFAIMREMIDFTPLFPKQSLPVERSQRFDCIIVDEVDNLTIDTALNKARLGYPAELTFDWIYSPLFHFVQQNFTASQKEILNSKSTIEKLRQHLQQYKNGAFHAHAEKLTDKQLNSWLSSAFQALYEFQEDQDYIVENKSELVKKIVIVDAANTGRLIQASRWSYGLHEFLEVKHDIEVEQESLTPLSLSHAVFYPMYEKLYGLTGTLGSVIDRQELKDIYGIEGFDVPTYRIPQRQDSRQPLILKSDEEYLSTIIDKIQGLQKKGRPTLVLCKTIEDSEFFSKALQKQSIPHEMLNEKQKKSEEKIIEHAGMPISVTVATNTAGRGTDIKLSSLSEKNGGLHVLLTFDPESQRVEDQARGRAGRQGQLGSSEIILSAARLGLSEVNDENIQKYVERIQDQREFSAKARRHTHICRTGLERHLFSLTLKFYESLEKFMQLIKNEKFLHEKSVSLGNRKLTQAPPTLNEILAPGDDYIASEVIKLMMNKLPTATPWKNLLVLMFDRVKNKVIVNWSLQFYKIAEEIITRSNFAQNDIEVLLENAYKVYHETWQRYINPSGNGIIEYIRDITALKLKNI